MSSAAGSPRMKLARPSVLRYIRYSYGARLDTAFVPWVRRDLTGKGASTRMVVRWSLPCLAILAPLLFVPADGVVKAMMTVPILLPYVYFSIALNQIYRRHRLVQHGLDPALATARERARNHDSEQAYLHKYRGQ